MCDDKYQDKSGLLFFLRVSQVLRQSTDNIIIYNLINTNAQRKMLMILPQTYL